jgi:hypothetical protein
VALAAMMRSFACAESRYTNASLRQLLASHSPPSDVAMAMDALKRDTGTPLDIAVRAARRVVEAEWNRIDRLARALRRHGELDYDACRRVITRR